MASKYERLTIWYEEMDGNDFTFVGKKNANLGEMIKAGIPVSPGFALTVHAMDKFTIDTGIKEQLAELVTETDEVSDEVAKQTSEAAMRLIETTELPSDLQDVIVSDYRKLCEKSGVPKLSCYRPLIGRCLHARSDGVLFEHTGRKGPRQLRAEVLVERLQCRSDHTPDE